MGTKHSRPSPPPPPPNPFNNFWARIRQANARAAQADEIALANARAAQAAANARAAANAQAARDSQAAAKAAQAAAVEKAAQVAAKEKADKAAAAIAAAKAAEEAAAEKRRREMQDVNNLHGNSVTAQLRESTTEYMSNQIMTHEELLIDKINTFNQYYARYIHCNNIKINSDCVGSSDSAAPGYIPGPFTFPNSTNAPYTSNAISGISYNSIEAAAYADQMKKLAGTSTDSETSDTIIGLLKKIKNTDINDITSAGSIPNFDSSTYNQNIQDLKTKQAQNLSLRQDLDNKLNELYVRENSITNGYKQHYDSTIYSGVLLSALATSILFYLFKEL